MKETPKVQEMSSKVVSSEDARRLVPGIKAETFDLEVPYGLDKQQVQVKVVEYKGNDTYILETIEDNPEDRQRYHFKLVWLPLEVAYGNDLDKAKALVNQLSDADLMALRDCINSELNMLGKS